MKARILSCALFALVCVFAGACNSGGDALDKPKQIILDGSKTDSGECELGSQIVVVLEGNPTTGYEWILEKYDPSALTFNGSSFANKMISRKTGEGGLYRFFFRAKKVGKTSVLLNYSRRWEAERGVPPIDSAKFEIDVKPPEPKD